MLGLRPWFGSLVLGLLVAGCEGDPVYVGLEKVTAECVEGRCFVDPTLTAKTEDFSAAVSQSSLTFVYPLSGAVHPVNLPELTVQWAPHGSTQSAFHLRLGEDERAFDFYVPCLTTGQPADRGCGYRLPRELWRQAATTFAGKRVKLRIWGLAGEGLLVDAKPIWVEFSAKPVEGALHYWARSATAHSLQRAILGAERAAPQVTPPSADDPNACGGCHAVNRRGGFLGYTLGQGDPDQAIETNAAFDGRLALLNEAEPDDFIIPPTAAVSDSAMMTLNSTGTRVVNAYDRKLVLRDATSGEVLSELPEGALGVHEAAFFPEFSPDDSQLVVALGNDPAAGSDEAQEIAVSDGSIALFDIQDDTLTAEPRVLVPADDQFFHYYPSWSPDGLWIAFVSAPSGPGLASYARADTRLRLVSVESGVVYELERATGTGQRGSTWPRFAPYFECPGGEADCAPDERIFFFSLGSKRDYGYLRQNSLESSTAAMVPQLWLSRIRLAALAEGEDPSSPPLWLPYQEPFQHNYQAAWSERAGCNSDAACGAGALCVDTQCQITPSK